MNVKQTTYLSTQLIDDTETGNTIDVEWYNGEYLDLTAEWAGDIYGEGQLTLSKSQAKMLLTFLLECDLGD